MKIGEYIQETYTKCCELLNNSNLVGVIANIKLKWIICNLGLDTIAKFLAQEQGLIEKKDLKKFPELERGLWFYQPQVEEFKQYYLTEERRKEEAKAVLKQILEKLGKQSELGKHNVRVPDKEGDLAFPYHH